MDTQSFDILERSFDFRVKPASEYRQGEKVILTRDVDFDICILAGTEGVLTETGKYGVENIEISFKVFGKRVIGSADNIDSLENGQGELFRTFHDWIPCRRDNEHQGWLAANAPQEFRAKLDDGTIVEGEISMVGLAYDARVLTSVSIGGTAYPASRIQNMVFKKGSGSVSIPIGGVESNFHCLLDELIQIWANQGAYISPTGVKNQRVVEIGNAFNATGGMERMQAVAAKIRTTLGGNAVGRLDKAWDGIGHWMA